MPAERVRTPRPSQRSTGERPGPRATPAGSGAVPTTAAVWFGLQRAAGNRAVVELQRATVLQRTPLSDDLAARSAGKKPAEIFALVGEQKFRNGAVDAAGLAAMTTVLQTALPDANDRWVASRILAGRLGLSQGVAKKDEPSLKKGILPQPIEVSFVPGRSDERALVVAGVHGSERQGIDVARALLDVVRARQSYYSVIVVPSLFPEHADVAWGTEGKRERDTFTNRNFPDLNAEVADYKGGQAVDATGAPIKAAKDETGTERPILAENVMLMELIDRFHPSRIISIHGTWESSAAGVFADPHFLSPAKEKAITALASLLAIIAPFFGATGPDAQTLENALAKVDAARTQNDIDLALATAYAIDARTKGVASLKARFADAKRKTSPSVAGNKLYQGAGKESSTWREDMDPTTGAPKPWPERAKKKGISLGLYGPAKGISVFTVEPPVNRALDFYDDKRAEPSGGVVSKAEREAEIKAYADAVATVLLGPEAGRDALNQQRPPTP